MFSEEICAKFDSYCKQFLAFDIYHYEGGNYEDSYGGSDISDENWDNSQQLRDEFDEWIKEFTFNNKFVKVNFWTGGISVYALEFSRERDSSKPLD